MQKQGLAAITIICAVLWIYLSSTSNPGIWVSDEVAYTLTMKSLYDSGTLLLWNGNDEIISQELMLPSTLVLQIDDLYLMYGRPANLYAFFSLPFYHIWGMNALKIMNATFYCLTIITLYLMAGLFFKGWGKPFITAILYGFTSYSLQITRISIPHMISVFATVLSATITLHYILKKGDERMLRFSGFLMGISFGLRYPNIIFLPVSLALIHLYSGRKASFNYFLGGSLAVFLALGINQIYYGLFLVSGYGMIWKLATRSFIPLITVSITLIFGFALYRRKRQFMDRNKKSILLAAAVITVFSISASPLVREAISMKAHNFYTKIFDMTRLDEGVYGHPLRSKKALLQSTPYIILGLIPVITYAGSREKRAATFIYSIAASQIIFYCLSTPAAGGVDETYGVRYFLEAVPFLTLICMLSLRGWMDALDDKKKIITAAAIILAALLIYSNKEIVYPQRSLRITHTLLALSLGAVYFRQGGRPSPNNSLFTLLLVISVAFSAAVAFHDMNRLEKSTRDISNFWDAITPYVPDDSVLVVPKRTSSIRALGPKLFKQKVRVLLPTVGGYQDTLEIIEFYMKMGKPVYVLHRQEMEADSYYGNMTNIIQELEYEKLYWMNYTSSYTRV